jgi:Lrp/AsnC family leucine-responsive transcriptional regulator
MTAHVRSVEHLEELIDRFVVYAQTTTSIVQSAPVATRGVALGEEPTPAAPDHENG